MARTNNDPAIVVTGGNRGSGFEICRQLVARGVQVVLTARKRAAGEAAVKKLAGGKHAAAFHPLDVTDGKSIECLLNVMLVEPPINEMPRSFKLCSNAA
jgi:NAD(P)-dependent dehydrogenase (short-subunit alcohol dehydrogenase family)